MKEVGFFEKIKKMIGPKIIFILIGLLAVALILVAVAKFSDIEIPVLTNLVKRETTVTVDDDTTVNVVTGGDVTGNVVTGGDVTGNVVTGGDVTGNVVSLIPDPLPPTSGIDGISNTVTTGEDGSVNSNPVSSTTTPNNTTPTNTGPANDVVVTANTPTFTKGTYKCTGNCSAMIKSAEDCLIAAKSIGVSRLGSDVRPGIFSDATFAPGCFSYTSGGQERVEFNRNFVVVEALVSKLMKNGAFTQLCRKIC